jgi:hypothetical protein
LMVTSREAMATLCKAFLSEQSRRLSAAGDGLSQCD